MMIGDIQCVSRKHLISGVDRRHAPPAWHLYVIRTVSGALYTGIATDVRRRYQEHAAGGPKAARFLRAYPPREIAFSRRIGSRSLALKVEYRFKQLPKRAKEAIVEAGKLRFNRETGEIRR
jgi:putative endonuclease